MFEPLKVCCTLVRLNIKQATESLTEQTDSAMPFRGFMACVTSHAVLLFYVNGKHLWSCRDGQLT